MGSIPFFNDCYFNKEVLSDFRLTCSAHNSEVPSIYAELNVHNIHSLRELATFADSEAIRVESHAGTRLLGVININHWILKMQQCIAHQFINLNNPQQPVVTFDAGFKCQ